MSKPNEMIAMAVEAYVKESEQVKQRRMDQNRMNWDYYHGRVDFGHKLKGQSREHLPRVAMGVEQSSTFLHQGLLDFGDYFSANKRRGITEALFTESEAEALLSAQLDKADFYNFVLDALKSGLLGAVMIAKVRGCKVPRRRFIASGAGKEEQLLRSKDLAWQLKLDLVRQRNFHIDPTGKGLYKIEEREFDLAELEKFAKENRKMFNDRALRKVLDTAGGNRDFDTRRDLRSETNLSEPHEGFRKTIRVLECWGDIIDPATGKMKYERKVCWVANGEVIVSPRAYNTWDGSDPYVIAPLIRTPGSQWHKALADAPVFLNRALNEIFNLLIDSGIQSVFGIKQVREDWLERPEEIDGGLVPGQTVAVNASAPPGAKAIERVDTGSTGAGEAANAFNLASLELNQGMLQNDLRTGSLPQRAVKATEVVEASNSITSVFTGIAKSLEINFIGGILEKSWHLILQNFKEIDPAELRAILGGDEEDENSRYAVLTRMTDKQIFSKSYGGFTFKVFGLSQTLNKIKDYRKVTTLLQSIGLSPELREAFVRKYDFTKLLGVIMKSLDIDEDQIKHDRIEQQMNDLDMLEGPSGGVNPMNVNDGMQTQLPQVGAAVGGFQQEASSAEGFGI